MSNNGIFIILRFGESLTSSIKITKLTFLMKKKKKNQVALRGVYFWRILEKVLSQISFSTLKVSVLTGYKALRGTFVQKPLFKGRTLLALRDKV